MFPGKEASIVAKTYESEDLMRRVFFIVVAGIGIQIAAFIVAGFL